jgi:hypothetical protein
MTTTRRGEASVYYSHNVHFAAYFDITIKNIFHSEAECLTIGQTFCLYRWVYFFNIEIPIGRF